MLTFQTTDPGNVVVMSLLVGDLLSLGALVLHRLICIAVYKYYIILGAHSPQWLAHAVKCLSLCIVSAVPVQHPSYTVNIGWLVWFMFYYTVKHTCGILVLSALLMLWHFIIARMRIPATNVFISACLQVVMSVSARAPNTNDCCSMTLRVIYLLELDLKLMHCVNLHSG